MTVTRIERRTHANADDQTMSVGVRFGRRALVICAALSSIDSCSKTRPAPAVALTSCSLSTASVALGNPFELTCQFAVAPNAKIADDYQVLVQFVDAEGNVIWSDDHDPPVS